MREPVPYRDDLESVDPDEAAVIARIVEVMGAGRAKASDKAGRPVRASHAKAHGIARGTFEVLDGLQPAHAQGLFARPRACEAVVRLAHVPGEVLDDRSVSSPMGMAVKVLGVEGERLPGHRGPTQDFVLDSGSAGFIAADARSFLRQIGPVEAAVALPQALKGAVSAVARGVDAGLRAVGIESAKADFFGHRRLHPLAETYWSQAPLRWGAHVAKIRAVPSTPAQALLAGAPFRAEGPDGLRDAVVAFLRDIDAEWTIEAQLLTDEATMPVEDATAAWPEEESRFYPVARLRLPAQDAWDPAMVAAVDGGLLFCPAHSLAAHRPLGSVMRARMAAYEALGRARIEATGRTLREPGSLAELLSPP